MNIAKSLFLLSLLCALSLRAAELESGPMLGHTTAIEANIWAKASGAGAMSVRIGTKKDLSDGREIDPVALSAESDFMATVKVDGLEAEARYFYQMMIDGEAKGAVESFVTASGKDSGRLRFAFTSCLGEKGSESAGGWTEMAKKANSEMVLLLGDNHYANTAARAGQSAAYLDHRSVDGFRDIAARVPIYSIWDDHDYGPNDSDGTLVGKEESLATFKDFWANPAYGEEGTPGVYYNFARKGIEFFMLDSRYHRSPDRAPQEGMKTMLGDRQLQWLLNGLKASTAKVKVVSCGSEWQMNGHLDSWTSYARERVVILDFIKNEKITGVILLSGDRHFTAGYQLRGEVIEVTSGPLGSKNFPTENLPEMFMNHGDGKMFCVFDIDTTAAAPEIALEVFRAGEGMIDRRILKWSQVIGEEKMAYLPVPKKLVWLDDFEKGDVAWSKTDDNAWRVWRGR
jgi:alkaline phosphatase D